MSEGYPKNITVIENSNATLHCKVLVDQSVHITWAKTRVLNETDVLMPGVEKIEVSI